MNSILFGDTMVPIIEYEYILLLGIVFYRRNIILLGLTTKKTATHVPQVTQHRAVRLPPATSAGGASRCLFFPSAQQKLGLRLEGPIVGTIYWVVVKIMVLLWVP